MSDANNLDVHTEASEIVSQLASGFVDSWNSHDMASFAELFHGDGDFVNVVGLHMRGRDEIQRHHASAHAGPFRASTLRLDVEDAREIAPGVLVGHVRGTLRGDSRDPSGVRTSMLTFVIERRSGVWKIVTAHNTNIPPERP